MKKWNDDNFMCLAPDTLQKEKGFCELNKIQSNEWLDNLETCEQVCLDYIEDAARWDEIQIEILKIIKIRISKNLKTFVRKDTINVLNPNDFLAEFFEYISKLPVLE